MEEFYDAGTESAPRVSYIEDTNLFLVSGNSDCREPSVFYAKYSALLCNYVTQEIDSKLYLRLSFEFISSGSLTAVEHMLNDISLAVGNAGWNENLKVFFSRYSEPTVEDAESHLVGLSKDWPNINFEVEPHVGLS